MNMTTIRNLPPAELTDINIGYMRLVDSAPLIIAKELGFYKDLGLNVTLQREVSWANIRDKTVAGMFDACQMLAAMPLMTTLGAAGIRAPMITGLVLSLNGDAITVSASLWSKLQKLNVNNQSALSNAKALKQIVDKDAPNQLTFATVHSFSNHTILLRRWLQAGGINPNTDVRIIVLPPEQMIDSLAQGVIDGFCAGSPWNTIAVDYGIGTIATTGFEVWNNAPSKVLGTLETWHTKHPTTHLRLRLAVMQACEWLEDLDNREKAVTIIGASEYLDLPEKYLRPSLTGQLVQNRATPAQQHDNFHVFARFCSGFPWRSQAETILTELAPMLGKSIEKEKTAALAQQCFRTDLYREAATKLNQPYPSQDHKPQGRHTTPWMLGDIELGSDLMLGD
ncbi:MAG: ABC-type nitrate/sulfonate/bicarbonate transport system substrate-binding protein [Chitinophagales bacterium]|jgi:nitrate/nitrite transport system substrate-binding protein